ncbi:MAG: RHS repeat-associated core domain-containing protein [Chthoniobacterales bacterium]
MVMNCATAEATIHFTVGNSGYITPTEADDVYTLPVVIDCGRTRYFSAMSTRPGWTNSAITQQTASVSCTAQMNGELPASAARVVNYTLDKAGNRDGVSGVEVHDANGMIMPYTYVPNVLNEYTQAHSQIVANNSQHEIAAYDGVSYQYIGDTRLRSVSSGAGRYELAYDALGRCVRRTTDGQTSVYYGYDGERPLQELNAAGDRLASSVYGIGLDEIISRYNNGLQQFLQQDRLGNTSAITDELGVVTESYRYDAFGQPSFFSAPTAQNRLGTQIPGTLVNNRFLFTGREWVARYGFYEYRNRAYNPTLGRFMSEDPKSFAAGDRNLFRYCNGDPVNRVDPMGLTDTALTITGGGDWIASADGITYREAELISNSKIQEEINMRSAESTYREQEVTMPSGRSSILRHMAVIMPFRRGKPL